MRGTPRFATNRLEHQNRSYALGYVDAVPVGQVIRDADSVEGKVPTGRHKLRILGRRTMYQASTRHGLVRELAGAAEGRASKRP